jgi:hypothetical protein
MWNLDLNDDNDDSGGDKWICGSKGDCREKGKVRVLRGKEN